MKKLKQFVCLFALTSVIFSLVSCKPETDDSNTELIPENGIYVHNPLPDESENASPAFKLNRLPDIGKYSSSDEKFERFYPGHTPKLIPSENYGQLVPFIGAYTDYSVTEEDMHFITESVSYPKYGLCTTDGKIVVDAVYSFISTVTDADLTYYLMTKETVSAPDEWRTKNYVVACATDGSWLAEITDGNITYIHGNPFGDDGRIIIMGGDPMNDNDFTYTMRDFKGNTLFEESVKDGWITFGDFGKEGLAPITVSINGNNPQRSGYYININGNKILRGFADCSEFYGGVAVVSSISEEESENNGRKIYKYGVIDTEGCFKIAPEYDNIFMNRDQNLLLMNKDDKTYIADFSEPAIISDTITELEAPFEGGTFSFVGKDSGILHFFMRKLSEYHEFTDLSTGKKIVSKSLKASPNISPNYDSDILAYLDRKNKVFTFMDKSGKTLYTYQAPKDSVSDYFNTIDERFVTIYVNNNYDDMEIIDLKNQSSLGIFEGTSCHTCIAGKYLILNRYERHENENSYGTTYFSILNGDTGEYLLENVRDFVEISAGESQYISYVENGYIYLAKISDDEISVILKLRDSSTD